MRPSGRAPNKLRPIEIIRQYTKHAEGSVLIRFGDTHVLCTASVKNQVPKFLKGKNQGWITAEYGMLPRSTHERIDREAARGKQSGRTQEIQRLIGRSLRSTVNLSELGEYTITIDCDVIQADGGTRTASITGGCVALIDALNHMHQQGLIASVPLQQRLASVSVGIVQDTPVLDLDYAEDSSAETDMNVIMNEKNEYVEIQGTAEGKTFSHSELNAMLELAQQGIQELLELQQKALA